MRKTKFPSTSTKTKKKIVKIENDTILRDISVRSAGALVGGVVGRADGLDRHIKQYLALGFKEENIHIFEIMESMYEELDCAIKAKGYKVTLHFCDMLNPTGMSREQLNRFEHLDVDITTALDIHTFIPTIEAIHIRYPNLKSFVFVHSARYSKIRSLNIENDLQGYEPLFDSIKNQNISASTINNFISSFKSVWDYYKNQDNCGKSAFIKHLQQKFEDYSIKIIKYPGVGNSTMYSFTFVKSIAPLQDLMEFGTGPTDYAAGKINALKNNLIKWSSRKTISKQLFVKYHPVLVNMCNVVNIE
jgi:hypothetical protein